MNPFVCPRCGDTTAQFECAHCRVPVRTRDPSEIELERRERERETFLARFPGGDDDEGAK